MEYHPEYASAGTVVKVFLRKTLIAFMVGLLFSFVLLDVHPQRTHREAAGESFFGLEPMFSVTVTSRGPGEN